MFQAFSWPCSPGPDDHIHRIGRTGRAGVPGRAVTFLDSRESKEAREAGTDWADRVSCGGARSKANGQRAAAQEQLQTSRLGRVWVGNYKLCVLCIVLFTTLS